MIRNMIKESTSFYEFQQLNRRNLILLILVIGCIVGLYLLFTENFTLSIENLNAGKLYLLLMPLFFVVYVFLFM